MLNKSLSTLTAAACLTTTLCQASFAADVPAPGQSPRIDAIKASGKLRVGVLNNPPFLVEKTGAASGDAWDGPGWIFAKQVAKELGVTVDPVRVSNETKVAILNSNGVDITVTLLGPTPERLKVIDFVDYSATHQCLYGLASNPVIARAKTVNDLNSPDVELSFIIGTPQEQWLKERFPKAKIKGVVTSSTTPIEEIMARRSDAATIQTVQVPGLQRKVKGLKVFPQENNCLDSKEEPQTVAFGIDKNQAAFKKYLQSVVAEMSGQLKSSENKMTAEMVNAR